MDKRKVWIVVKGYLWKEKRTSLLIFLFLCFIPVFLLNGSQLFQDVETADRLNAQALEGKYHAVYFDIPLEDFEKIRECPFVLETGMRFSLGQAEDGTAFAYLDETFRDLSAETADKNLKQTSVGHWAKKKNEAVFTRNFIEKYRLHLGDRVWVDLTAADADTGDVLYELPGLQLTVSGIIENAAGFTDQKNAYVSKALADSVMKTMNKNADAVVRFDREDKITENFQRLNEYLGYDREKLETVHAEKNTMLADAADEAGRLKKQNQWMNCALWILCTMVLYHIFQNRFLEKKRDFINLRKIGFLAADLLKIAAAEFFIFIIAGFAAGALAGVLVHKLLYLELMKMMIDTYDPGRLVSFGFSWRSLGNTVCMLGLISIPCMAAVLYPVWNTRNAAAAESMRGRRKNRRKTVWSFLIVSLSAVLISVLGILDNDSDAGIRYVKTYVPGDLQLTAGSIFENIMGGSVPVISDEALRQIKDSPEIEKVQSYEINYSCDVFLCEEKADLNAGGGFYETMLEMEQEIDGRKQCLYNLILVAADDMMALVPSCDEADGACAAVMEGSLAQTLNLKNGDHFTIYDKGIIENGSKDGCICADAVLLDTENIVLSESHLGGNLLIVDQKTADKFPGRWSRQVVNIWAEEGKQDAAASGIKRIAEKEGYSFHNAREQMQAYMDSDRNQKTMQSFFILVLALIGALTYFNTVSAELLSRRNDFALMHRIGIRRMEMYGMVLKEGMLQGVLTLAVVCAVQAVLCINGHSFYYTVFVPVDAGVLASCVLFPAAVSWYLFRARISGNYY